MAMEFFMVHGISERKNIILRKLRSRILKYILHRYINSNIFTKKKMILKYYGHKILINIATLQRSLIIWPVMYIQLSLHISIMNLATGIPSIPV